MRTTVKQGMPLLTRAIVGRPFGKESLAGVCERPATKQDHFRADNDPSGEGAGALVSGIRHDAATIKRQAAHGHGTRSAMVGQY
jgi:hypothetical protein